MSAAGLSRPDARERAGSPDANGARYLELMKRVLTNVIYEDVTHRLDHANAGGNPRFDAERRRNGLDWPSVAHTMIGRKRLDNLHECLERVVADDVPGDLAETGVWRGGSCIFMRAFLAAHGITGRQVWVADSFEGMPDTDGSANELDRELALHRMNEVLGIPLEVVRDNFRRYGLLDEQVRFLPGWFADTLPDAPVSELAVLRLDGDLYESTMDALVHLYPRLSRGGFVIVDDYALPPCRAAVREFRRVNGIHEPVEWIDYMGVYWRREC
ncbi:class I SAM-dependent methyltransferase [Saccharopolyspora erythraea]|uniref:TylF/MycF family methyltransferase n=1 Tax=Saccharopolyspora erythraea TaxID=1836 RepID=UPI001BA9C507|nr:TylF/MycF family methyltransferase [Saccharopolyspora erythraea]QUG99994.1 class I SAM-dependent methyltransferase [Saccharopolyspora erythraea]